MAKNDLTAEMLYDYMNESLLTDHDESLSITIPHPEHKYGIERGIILRDLIHNLTSWGFFQFNELDPKNIESMVLFGGILYKHNPKKRVIVSEERHKRKYVFFGPIETIPANIRYYPEFPQDFRIMVLTKDPVNDRDLIVPENEPINGDWKFPFKLNDKEKFPYEAYFENLVYESRFREHTDDHNLGGWHRQKNQAGVNVSYRSIEQFLKGIENNDLHSREVFMHGVPFLGEESFLKTIGGIDLLRREPLHSHTWTYSVNGLPSVKII